MTLRRFFSRDSASGNQSGALPGKTSGITGTAAFDGLCFAGPTVSKGARAMQPATAMEKIMNAPVDRRAFLATTVAVSATGRAGSALALPTSARSPEDVGRRIGDLAEEISELLPHDPLVDALNAYHKSLDAYERHPIGKKIGASDEEITAAIAVTYGPALNTLENWTEPAVTRAGAIAALRFVVNESQFFAQSEGVPEMARAALSYLESMPA